LYGAAVLFSILPFAFAGRSIHTPQMADVHFVVPSFANVLTNLCFLQGFVGSPLRSNDVVWTLAVEVACYLMAPLLAKLRTSSILIIAAVSAASFAFYPRLHLGYYADLSFGLPLLFLAWAWLAGFAFYRHRENPVAAAALIAAGAILVNFNNAFGAQFSVMTIALSAFVVVAASYISLPSFLLRALSYLGDLSYPFYLFHLPALLLAWAVLGIRNPWLLAGFSIAVSAAFLLMDTAMKVLLRPREPAESMPVQTQPQVDLDELTGISTSA
jgi:peptidoglycan/LPS O-acetylase OafA/YrhL